MVTFCLMIRRPPRSTLFPYTRSSDLPFAPGRGCSGRRRARIREYSNPERKPAQLPKRIVPRWPERADSGWSFLYCKRCGGSCARRGWWLVVGGWWMDMFWGGRYGKIVDPFGHEWGINQQVKELSPDETQDAADMFFAKRE